MSNTLSVIAGRYAATLKALERRALGTQNSENPFCPHIPTERQRLFLELDCEEALYGGAAGGAKTDALLMDGLKYVNEPGYSAIIFRRTYADLALPDALMDRAHRWFRGSAARWSEKDKTWTFPSGATLTFGYLDDVNDKYRYQGSQYMFIGFDELTQHLPTNWNDWLWRANSPSGDSWQRRNGDIRIRLDENLH